MRVAVLRLLASIQLSAFTINLSTDCTFGRISGGTLLGFLLGRLQLGVRDG